VHAASLDAKRDQNSFVFLRRGLFVEASIKELTADVMVRARLERSLAAERGLLLPGAAWRGLAVDDSSPRLRCAGLI
jgi:hypothetical protein